MIAIRSFRLRIALLSSAATVAVVAAFSAFVHEWLRAKGLRDVDEDIAAQARVAVSQPRRPIVWHEIDRRLAAQNPGTVLFAWMGGARRGYRSAEWPAGVAPEDLAPDLTLPEGWESMLVTPPPDGGVGPGPPPARDGAGVELGRIPDAVALRGPRVHGADPRRRYRAFAADDATLLIGGSAASVDRDLAEFRAAAGAALLPTFALAFAAGFVVAGRSLRSVRKLADAVERVTAAGLDRRLEDGAAEREFARLVQAFNKMMARLEVGFQESRRFADNAAHEMRTPLTILQGKLEEAIRSAYPGSPQQQMFTELLEEVARLKGIVDRLLILARSDAGRLELFLERVDLAATLEGMIEDFSALAPNLRFDARIARGLELDCDRALTAQIFHNLLSNAIKYNRRENGTVRVELETRDGAAMLRVANTGRPIKAEDQDRIFERFYRADQSHSRRIEGTGLGLGLARDIARAHGGELALEYSREDETAFVLRLPAGKAERPGDGRRASPE